MSERVAKTDSDTETVPTVPAVPAVVVERLALVLTALATLVSLFTAAPPVTLGVLTGGLLGTANFFALRWLVSGLVADGVRTATEGRAAKRGSMMGLLVLKFGLMGAALFVVLRFVPVDGTALLVGVSLVVLSIFVEAVRVVVRGSRDEAGVNDG